MKEDMPAIDLSAIENLREINDEQDVVQARLSKMETMKSRVSDAVYNKVRGEHDQKLYELAEKAEPIRVQVRQQYTELKQIMDGLQGEVDEQNLVKEEIELRHAIGEFTDEEHQEKMKSWEVANVEKQAEIESLQDMKRLFLSVFDSEEDLESGATEEADEAPEEESEPVEEPESASEEPAAEEGEPEDIAAEPESEANEAEPEEDRITTEDLEDAPGEDAFVNPEDNLDELEEPAELLSSDDFEEEPEELSADAMIVEDKDDEFAEATSDHAEDETSEPTADEPTDEVTEPTMEDAATIQSEPVVATFDEEPDAWAAAEAGEEWDMASAPAYEDAPAMEDPDATLLQPAMPLPTGDMDDGATIQYDPSQMNLGNAVPGTMAMPLPGFEGNSDEGDENSTVMMDVGDLPQLPDQDDSGDIDDDITGLNTQLEETDETDDSMLPPPILNPPFEGDGQATEIMDLPRFDQPMNQHDGEMTTPLPPPNPDSYSTTNLEDPDTEAAEAFSAEPAPLPPETEPATMMMNSGEIADAVGDDTEGTMIISNPKVRSLNNSTEGQETTLGMGTTSIGRSPDNDIHITEDRVSRKHAQITFGPGGYAIYDLNSENGTYVNGNRVREHFLSDGDIIMVGTYKFLYRDR